MCYSRTNDFGRIKDFNWTSCSSMEEKMKKKLIRVIVTALDLYSHVGQMMHGNPSQVTCSVLFSRFDHQVGEKLGSWPWFVEGVLIQSIIPKHTVLGVSWFTMLFYSYFILLNIVLAPKHFKFVHSQCKNIGEIWHYGKV